MNGLPEPLQSDWRPSFVVIGAVKAATTWVLEQLQANPSLYMPDPEPHYFSSEYHRGEEYYRSFFDDVAGSGRIRGEKSADYLAHPDAPQRLSAMLPKVGLVVQFRNPIDRAYSDYKMLYRRGMVRGTPAEYLTSLDNPQPRFLNDGLYSVHLGRWLDHFPEHQIHSLLYEDVIHRPRQAIELISRHIGVEPVFDLEQSKKRANDGSERFLPLPIRRALAPFKRSVAPLREVPWFEATRGILAREIAYPKMPTELRERLRDFYATDVERLGKTINRDLTHWLEIRPEKPPFRSSLQPQVQTG